MRETCSTTWEFITAATDSATGAWPLSARACQWLPPRAGETVGWNMSGEVAR